MKALAALVFLSVFNVLPAQADESVARRRFERLRLLDHRPPLRSGGRARPDSVGAYDLLLNRVELDLPSDGRVLPEAGRVHVELMAGGAGLEEVGLLSFFLIPFEIRRNGVVLEHFRNPETGELSIRLDRPARRGEVVSLDIEGTFEGYCLDATGCIEDGRLRHLVEFGWYPLSNEFPVDDRFDLELVLRAPADLTPAATGARQAPERDGRSFIWRYRSERPMTLGAYALGPFVVEPIDGTVEIFVPPDNVDGGRFLGREAVQVVDFYEGLLGPFPFGRLGVAPIADEAGVGLGPQAQVFLPTVFWLIDERLEEAALVREVLSHEIGHQYFFNLVGIVDAAEGWMSEGFAEYAATRYSELTTNTRDHARLNYWEYVLGVDEAADVPLNSEAVNTADPTTRIAVIYDKGSAVLWQLRDTVPNFDEVLRGYISRFAGEIVTTRDFERFIEQATGLDMSAYFSQWVRGAGFPRVQLTVQRPRDGAEDVVVRATQLPGRHGPFRANVPMRGHFADGETRTETFLLGPAEQTLRLGAAQWLDFDPDLTIFRRVLPEPAGDVNLSGVVDGMDLLDVWATQGRTTPDPRWSDALDVTRDQTIDDRDLAGIMEQFGQGW